MSYKYNRCSGWVHAKCSRLLIAAQHRRKSYWICDTCSAPLSQQLPPNHLYSLLCLLNSISNANGIGNKLTELGVVLERNKAKVAGIQESKLSPKSKNPCIWNYATVCKDRPHGHGGGLLIFIHRSITFSKQP